MDCQNSNQTIETLSNMLKESQDAFLSKKNPERILSREEHFRIWDEMWRLILEDKRKRLAQ